MSIYVMTDIHGCYDAMKRVLAKIDFSDGNRLICAGDYIDRGRRAMKSDGIYSRKKKRVSAHIFGIHYIVPEYAN